MGKNKNKERENVIDQRITKEEAIIRITTLYRMDLLTTAEYAKVLESIDTDSPGYAVAAARIIGNRTLREKGEDYEQREQGI